MRVLLAVLAILLLVWAVLLLTLREHILAAADLTPVVRSLANGWGLTNLVLGVLLLNAARNPARNLPAVYAAIGMAGLRTFNDLYGMLELAPAHALVSLADLVLSVAIFVGILRELPRTLAAARSAGSTPT